MFDKRFGAVLNAIDAKNKDISELAGIDNSNISRFRKGTRIPKKESDMAHRIEDAIYTYAHTHDRITALCSVLNISKDSDKSKTIDSLNTYLFEGISDLSSADSDKKTIAAKTFGERLSISMGLAELSNVRLSRFIRVDSSLISRFRSGLRIPVDGSEISEKLCDVTAFFQLLTEVYFNDDV